MVFIFTAQVKSTSTLRDVIILVSTKAANDKLKKDTINSWSRSEAHWRPTLKTGEQ